MGWLFTAGQTKEQLIERCLTGRAAPGYFTPIAHSLVGNHLWAAYQRKPDAPLEYDFGHRQAPVPERIICLYLLEKSHDDDGWGYKAMDESSHPYYYDCPLKYLDMVPDPGDSATEWRKGVRQFHDQKRDRKNLTKNIRAGMRLKLIDGCKPAYVTVLFTRPKLIGEDDNRIRYKIQPRHIERIERIEEVT